MGLRGSVKAFSLEQLLEFLSSSGHDGTLNIHHKDSQKTLYLHKAGLFLERSQFSFRLGDAMVRSGELTPEQLEEGLKLQQESEGKFLGQCLIELGHATDKKILSARRYQVEEEIYEVFGWEGAFFEFEKDALPKDFTERLKDPEEFRFQPSSVLMEATRRNDEWRMIQENLPSEKRLYVLSSADGALKRATKELKEARSRITDPMQVFDGMKTLAELPHLLGLSRFETQSVVSRLIGTGDVRGLQRHELESRFRMAIRSNIEYAVRLYECALESAEFETRGRFLDRVFFGSDAFKTAAEEGLIKFTARIKGKRAFELLLSLFRQGITCAFSAREEGHNLRLAFSKSSLVWRVEEGESPPSIVKHLLARSPVSASDLVRVREMQEQTGRTLQQILVGGGYVTMENWFRAQKDTVLNELFKIFFMQRPYVEVLSKEDRDTTNPGLDIDVPLLPWLHAEVMKEIRNWETILAQIPSVRAFLVVTPKGEKSLQGHDDPIQLFNGQRSLEEVLGLQELSAAEFLADVHAKLQSGRLAPLEATDYSERLEAAIQAGKRSDAINYCLAAIESGIEPEKFEERLGELQTIESELTTQSSRATLRGDLEHFSLPEVMQTFHLRKSSGTLRVEAEEGDKKVSRQIYFDQGDVYLLSGDVEESLGGEDLEVGLVAAGLVTEDQLADAAAQQMKDEVYEMFLWSDSEFEWAADYLPPEFYASRGNRKIRLNTVNFLLGAVRRIASWEHVREMLPSDDMVLAFDSNMTKMSTVAQKGNEDLLLLADGRHAISDLVRMSRTRRFKALTLLAELVDEGTLKIVDLEQIQEEDEDALFASDLPTSGVIEPGFVGQIQFVGTLQDLAGARMNGVMRVTDGRRSKELALIEGEVYRTRPFYPQARSDKQRTARKVELSPEAKRLLELEAMDWDSVSDDERPGLEMEMNLLRQVVGEEQPAPEEEEEKELSPEAKRLAELDAMDWEAVSDDERPGLEMERTLLRQVVAEERGGDEPEAEEKELSPEAKRLAELDAMDWDTVPEEDRSGLEMERTLLRQAIEMEQEEAQAQDEEVDLSQLSDEERAQKEFELQMRQAQEEMEEEQRKKEAQEAVAKEAAVDTARNFAECFSWRGTRFELIKGVLPGKLEDPETRGELWLHGETFFDTVAEAGERWVKIGELIPKDLVVAFTSDEAKATALERAGENPGLVELVDGSNTSEDVARISGKRYEALSWLVDLFEEGLAEGVEPQAQEGDSEEDWDFSL